MMTTTSPEDIALPINKCVIDTVAANSAGRIVWCKCSRDDVREILDTLVLSAHGQNNGSTRQTKD